MVAEMAKCQEKLGGKYLSAFPTTWWDRLEKGERVLGSVLYDSQDHGRDV